MKMEKCKISVIIPCYNASKTICETLSSLSEQSVLPDEVICIDDGSTDQTLDVIYNYKKNTELNIQVIQQINAGVSAARNRGMEKSSGSVLLFLDADDKYSQNYIQYILQGMQAGYDTVYGFYTHAEDKLLQHDDCVTMIGKDRFCIMDDFMLRKNKFHTSAFAYKRSLLEQYQIRFTDGARYGEDWEFTTKYLDVCRNGILISSNVLFYRQSEGSAMCKVTYAHTDAIAAAKRVEVYLKETGSNYYQNFYTYMQHRTIFSIAHTFSKHSAKDLFRRYIKEYPVKKSMYHLVRHKKVGKKIKLAAIVFIISPNLFFYTVGRR